MSEPLIIFQYQSVIYTDTTTGASPFDLAWSFSGGIPLSATANSQTVFYNVPGFYTASLTATDVFGTTSTLVEPSLIQVIPSTLIAGISGPTPSLITMNEGYQISDASIGDPYPAIGWLWSLPNGVTAGTQSVGVTGYIDWEDLTGSYSGSPGSIYDAPILLTANNGFNSVSSSAIVQVQKLGPDETLFMNATGPDVPLVVTGFTGNLPSNILAPFGPITTSNFFYPEIYWIVKLNFIFRGITNRTNQFFHSTNESGLIRITTGLWNYLPPFSEDLIPGFIIIQNEIYTDYSSVIVDSAISSGQYLIENQSSEFFLADETNFLEGLHDNHNYSVPLIGTLLSNPYKILHSGNIQFENSMIPPGTTGMSFVDPLGMGASGENPMIYSSGYLQNLTLPNLPSPPFPVYTVFISVNIAGTPYGATAPIGAPGSTGNDPVTNGDFFVAQDNLNGLGFVSFLNMAISSSIPGGTGSIDFVASPEFNCSYNGPSGPSYDPTNYNGVALRILNNTTVVSVTITDNSQAITSTYPLPPAFPVAPFTANLINSQGSSETCSGLADTILTTNMGPAGLNTFTFGGSIGYP